jgi:hypothetical protein
MHFYIKHNNNLVSFSVEASPSQGRYDLHISHADYDRDNGKFECRIKEDGTGKLLRPLHSYAASLIPVSKFITEFCWFPLTLT